MLTQESTPLTQETSIAASEPSEKISSDNPEVIVIENKFGTFEFNLKNAVNLSKGLVGMPDLTEAGFIQFPDERLAHVMILQSLVPPYLTFLTMPIDLDLGLIDKSDIEEACEQAAIPLKDLAVFGIITIRKNPEESKITVNLRAPLLVDVEKRTASQVVLTNSKYSVQTPVIFKAQS